MEPIFTCGEFLWIPEDQLAKSTLLTPTMVPLGSFQICSYAKERVGAESNGKLPHLFIPSKTAYLESEFVVEDLPLDRTEFAVKDLPLSRTLWWWCRYGILVHVKLNSHKFLNKNNVPVSDAEYCTCSCYHHQIVLLKGRSFTANSVLPKGRSSTAKSGTRLQFY